MAALAAPSDRNEAVKADGRISMYWPAARRNAMPGLALTAVAACVSAQTGAADTSQVAAQSPTQPAMVSQSMASKPIDTGDQLQEVVVTAELRAERLEDVPASVEVFTQEKLDVQAVGAMDDLTRLTPGVTFLRNGQYSNSSGAQSDIAVRGIDSIAGAATTALYIDDTPIQTRHLDLTSENAYPALFDLDRVEILRGPQGTLFGAGAEGGAVRFISPDPGLTKSSGYLLAQGSSTAGGDPSYEVGAAAGGPIIDNTLGFRVSASFLRNGGWVNRVDFANDSTIDPRSNWEQLGNFRGALTLAVTDNLSITPSVYYQYRYLNDTETYWKGLSNPSADQFNNGNVIASPDTDKFYLPALKVQWKLGAFDLISNTSYFTRNQGSTTDSTFYDRAIFLYNGTYPVFPYPPPGVAGPEFNTDRQYNLIQEVRLESADPNARLKWVAGIFYEHVREDTSFAIADPNLPNEFQALYGASWNASVGPLLPGGFLEQIPYAWALDKQLAAYGQVDWKVLDSLTLTAGARVSTDTSSGAQYSAGPLIGPTPASNAGSTTEHPVTPKFGISYQPESDELYYATASKGYRIGGINSPLSSLCAGNLADLSLASAPVNYKSDSLWSYEIGTKDSLLNRRLQINTSGFYIKWSNIQNTVYLPNCGFSFVANLGTVTSKGADADILLRPIDPLLLELAASYTDARYDSSVYAAPGATAALAGKGDYLPVAPWTLVGSAEYKIPVLLAYGPYARVDYSYSARYKSPLVFQDPSTISYDPAPFYQQQAQSLSARLGFRLSGFDVSVFGTNLTNTHPVLFDSRYYPPLPLFFDTTWRPRTLGVTAMYRY
jgi:iron complex outermembrane recepter protein